MRRPAIRSTAHPPLPIHHGEQRIICGTCGMDEYKFPTFPTFQLRGSQTVIPPPYDQWCKCPRKSDAPQGMYCIGGLAQIQIKFKLLYCLLYKWARTNMFHRENVSHPNHSMSATILSTCYASTESLGVSKLNDTNIKSFCVLSRISIGVYPVQLNPWISQPLCFLCRTSWRLNSRTNYRSEM